MRTATVTYVAPLRDSKVVEMGGVTFFDGKSVEINSHEHPHLITKLQHNHHFDVVVSEDDKKAEPPKAKRGRPSAADIAAAKELADQTERDAKIAADKAKDAKADVQATEKAASEKPDAKQADPVKPIDPKPTPMPSVPAQ